MRLFQTRRQDILDWLRRASTFVPTTVIEQACRHHVKRLDHMTQMEVLTQEEVDTAKQRLKEDLEKLKKS